MLDRDELLAESRWLSGMLVRVAERAKSEFADTVLPFGIPVHLARAILMLDRPAPMRILADRLACDRSYITGLADQLEERGLVARATGEDRRVKLLALTESGLSLRNQISQAVAEQSLVLRRLSESERKTLAPLLERLLSDEPDI
jgi:DNA-binding MarR family transcriptional regulator